jgi:hypothetical protein
MLRNIIIDSHGYDILWMPELVFAGFAGLKDWHVALTETGYADSELLIECIRRFSGLKYHVSYTMVT